MKHQLVIHSQTAFLNAENGVSKIDDHIKEMEGMTGLKTRHFYNNLLAMEDARYLEIGTWKGSSVCSAMAGNKATVVCIDDWSEFGDAKDDFLNNFEKHKGYNKATFIEADCFSVDVTTLGKFNIYLYDGRHYSSDQQMALTHYVDCMDDIFIYVVDDWNWDEVRSSTLEAMTKLNLEIIWSKEVITGVDDHDVENWWNGIGIFVLGKQPNNE